MVVGVGIDVIQGGTGRGVEVVTFDVLRVVVAIGFCWDAYR